MGYKNDFFSNSRWLQRAYDFKLKPKVFHFVIESKRSMKSKILILIFIDLVSLKSFSQYRENPSLRILFGAVAPFPTYSPSSIFDASRPTGFIAYVGLDVPLNPYLSMVPAIAYMNKGIEYGFDVKSTTQNNYQPQQTSSSSFNYLQFPIDIRLKPFHWLSFGPGIVPAYLLSSNYELNYGDPSSYGNTNQNFKRLDFGVSGNLEFTIPTGIGISGISFKYTKGLLNIVKNSSQLVGNPSSIKFDVFEADLVYSFSRN
jgi:hypothetical protein